MSKLFKIPRRIEIVGFAYRENFEFSLKPPTNPKCKPWIVASIKYLSTSIAITNGKSWWYLPLLKSISNIPVKATERWYKVDKELVLLLNQAVAEWVEKNGL